MRSIAFLAAAAALATAAGAQTGQGSHNPAVKSNAPVATGVSAQGANSFTEDQAKGRLRKAGYMVVGDLAKDDHGVWRGTAIRQGKRVKVGLDYKGNITKN